MNKVKSNIILIGPVGVGKSTQGKLIAEALNKRSISLDGVANEYYEEYGFGSTEFQKVKEENCYLDAYRQWWPALAFAAQRVLNDYDNCVIDYGAGHSHYEDKNLFKDVLESLSHLTNVILLLPSSDLDKSVSIIRQRSIEQRKRDWIHDDYDFIEHWVKDDSNHLLSTTTIYTEGKTPEQTRNEILMVINT